jgi:putative phage-type endonuclease
MDEKKENVNIDNVIDRLYIKYRHTHEPFTLIDEIYDTLVHVFTGFYVEREYVKNRIFKILDYQHQLKKLIDLPTVEQRSQEWYDMRQNLITASDFAQALGEGKFGTQKQFFQKKCGYEKDTFDQNNPALKWGVRYEPVANDAYERRNKTKMHEFGLLKHPELPWFGASPDAISELGIMIEIKCPWKRKITGEVPRQYYYQIQGQLDVCRLQECDYFECEFLEYANKEEFQRHFHDNNNEKGIIIEYLEKDVTKYEYSKMSDCFDVNKILLWKELVENKLKNIVKMYYWQLNTYSVVRVYKEDAFLNEKFPLLKAVWDKIQDYKKNRPLYDKEIASNMSSNSQSGGGGESIRIQRESSGKYSSSLNGNSSGRMGGDVSLKGFSFVLEDD